MINIKNILLGVLVLVISYFIYDKITQKPTIKYITTPVEVIVPPKEGELRIDSISYPIYIEVENPLNKKLLDKYNNATDSITKLNMYIDAITTRTYKETFEDSIQKINVTSKVQGKLLNQELDYFIKPYKLKTEVTIPIEIKNKFKVFVGAEIGAPVEGDSFLKPTLKGNLLLKNSKENILSVGADTEKRLWLGYFIKL